jgi:hypothetical protein
VSCRDCLFVKVDIASGGDIDGCLKVDILNEFKCKVLEPFSGLGVSKEKAMLFLNFESVKVDSEKQCVEVMFKQPKHSNIEEFARQNREFFEARERACRSYKQWVSDRLRANERLPMSILRSRYQETVERRLSAYCTKPLAPFLEVP